MTYQDKIRLQSINRLRAEGWTYARIARAKRFGGRDHLYGWLTARAVEIGGEWVPKDQVVKVA